jgi:diguanylate cyclase (GGDEF)-like protein
MDAVSFFEKRSKSFWVSVGFAFVFMLGIIDYFTGYEVSFSLFYLIPIFTVVWFTDGRMGLLLSSASALVWFIADYSAGLTYSHPSVYIWNTIIRLGFFSVVSILGSNLKKSYKLNLELVRSDYVTGAVSIRYFYELAQIEISRFQRYHRSFALAYIDLDDFKSINDRLGHSVGDRVLRVVTDSIRQQIRPSDTLARLGGDEFALLMPETSEDAAKLVISRLHSSLANEMLKNGWMVTFSVGVVICNETPKSVDDMVKIADDTMYSVKSTSKNGVNYRVYAG